MLAYVFPQFRTRFEHLFAMGTQMLLAHGVPSLVVLKDVWPTEPLVTKGASVSSFVRLPHVDEESRPTRKLVLALLAHK